MSNENLSTLTSYYKYVCRSHAVRQAGLLASLALAEIVHLGFKICVACMHQQIVVRCARYVPAHDSSLNVLFF